MDRGPAARRELSGGLGAARTDLGLPPVPRVHNFAANERFDGSGLSPRRPRRSSMATAHPGRMRMYDGGRWEGHAGGLTSPRHAPPPALHTEERKNSFGTEARQAQRRSAGPRGGVSASVRCRTALVLTAVRRTVRGRGVRSAVEDQSSAHSSAVVSEGSAVTASALLPHCSRTAPALLTALPRLVPHCSQHCRGAGSTAIS